MLLGEGLCFSLCLSSKAGVLGGARGVSLARRGSSSRKERNRSAEENLLPSAERKNCVRTQGNFYAHKNKFSCARKYFFVRTEISLRAHANFSPCGRMSFFFRRAIFFLRTESFHLLAEAVCEVRAKRGRGRAQFGLECTRSFLRA